MSSPQNNEIEITIMGNGYGECIVIHYGNGDWIVIDSFISTNKKPIAIEYLDGIGIDVSSRIKYIVVTHADTDHIKGISTLYKESKNAILILSNALGIDEFIYLANGSISQDTTSTISSKEEFSELFSELKVRIPNTQFEPCSWASSSKVIFNENVNFSNMNINRQLWALSPSNQAITKGKTHISQIYNELIGTNKNNPLPVGRIPKLHNNHTSVVLSLVVGNRNLLFGADLEELGDPLDGWENVIKLTGRPTSKSEFFKIPHHGSSNAHNDNVWSTMVEKQNTSCLTTYSKSKTPLPKLNQIQKIAKLSNRPYLVGRSELVRKRYDTDTNTLLRKIGKTVNTVKGSYGRITFRSAIDDPNRIWDIDCDGQVEIISNNVQ